MKRLLVLRFSALGDVSMTSTLVRAALEQNPDLHITWVTRPELAAKIPSHNRLLFWTTDFKGSQQTPWGVLAWVRSKMREAAAQGTPIDAVADLHRNLRTRVICAGLGWRGLPIERLVKDRPQRRALRLRGALQSEALTPVTTRMSEVFQRLGISLVWNDQSATQVLPSPVDPASPGSPPTLYLAPTARHKTKQWPISYSTDVAHRWAKQGGRVVLVGAASETALLSGMVDPKYPAQFQVAAGLPPEEEAGLRAECHVAITLDSGNLHLAVQSGLPVVSVWGGTHPKAGFLGPGHPRVTVLQAPDAAFPCRPCSIFGKPSCALGDVPCLHAVEPTPVFERAWEIATSSK